jgi:hypothetical protein
MPQASASARSLPSLNQIECFTIERFEKADQACGYDETQESQHDDSKDFAFGIALSLAYLAGGHGTVIRSLNPFRSQTCCSRDIV